jgi:hypothetical protein
MRDNKAFASLSSGLLARKGQARPAMRPQGFGFSTGNLDDLGWNDMGHDAGPRPVSPRLPANLAGPAVAAAAPAPIEVPVVVRQQEEIAREFAEPETVVEAAPVVAEVAPVVAEVAPTAPKANPAPKKAKAVAAKAAAAPKGTHKRTEGRKAAFTLRLNAERHLRLRLACAVQNRSAQLLVTDALDQLLDSLPDVARLAASLPAKD